MDIKIKHSKKTEQKGTKAMLSVLKDVIIENVDKLHLRTTMHLYCLNILDLFFEITFL